MLKFFFTIITLVILSSVFLFNFLRPLVPQIVPQKILFTPVYESTPLSCQTSFHHPSPPLDFNFKADKTAISKQIIWHYQQLQFFIHDVEIHTELNGWQPWSMTTNSHQANDVALLGEVCTEATQEQYWALELIPLTSTKDITDIRFTLGLPFSLNHLNPLTQPSPLNVSSMFWVWQGGHKFMRIELVSPADNWLFHLGSTGCRASSPIRAPKNECLQPNRILMSMPFPHNSNNITLDLAVLLNDLHLTKNHSCQSSPKNKHCKKLFKNLGIATKQYQQITDQMLFKVSQNE